MLSGNYLNYAAVIIVIITRKKMVINFLTFYVLEEQLVIKIFIYNHIVSYAYYTCVSRSKLTSEVNEVVATVVVEC